MADTLCRLQEDLRLQRSDGFQGGLLSHGEQET
jgi:hypothetical protein